jgi:hypothetical protein
MFSFGGEFGGCKIFGGNTTLKMNSCKYVISEPESAELLAAGWAGISCTTPGDQIEAINSLCNVKIGAQELGPVELTNTGIGSAATLQAHLKAAAEKVTYGPGSEYNLCFLLEKPTGTADMTFSISGRR